MSSIIDLLGQGSFLILYPDFERYGIIVIIHKNTNPLCSRQFLETHTLFKVFDLLIKSSTLGKALIKIG